MNTKKVKGTIFTGLSIFLIVLSYSCEPKEPIRETETTLPELQDTIINRDRIMNNEPE